MSKTQSQPAARAPQRGRSSSRAALREAQRRTAVRDLEVIGEALEALLARERASVVAWAHAFLRVGDAAFSGKLAELQRLHAFVPMPQVQALIEREREIADIRRRLGIRR